MAVAERIRAGGRSARIQASVHDAVRALEAETARADLTIPMIAARAGVTPSTIYRRWGELSELLADVAVARLRPISDPADTGAVKTDLRVWVEQYMEEMASPVGRAMIRDVLGGDPESHNIGQCCAFTEAQIRFIAERATGRGETAFDIDAVIDHVVAPIMYRILFNDRRPTLAYCQALIDGVMPEDTRPAQR
ncbi:TetR/AcrR family transcriptional regulator [Acidisoma cladoniae]|jgi:AcrR family transcriptional regulator|uniref:TetR/AcrR family transcriptional regulator n=1 Tax=Acidisoma cladoniae TaxID=3040935 RepID=UPI00254BCFB9|nr:TetR/AcrR family transcriptional regulator [Acidisoma sp. PAMC 29798]